MTVAAVLVLGALALVALAKDEPELAVVAAWFVLLVVLL